MGRGATIVNNNVGDIFPYFYYVVILWGIIMTELANSRHKKQAPKQKQRITHKSAKARARVLQNIVVDKLYEWYPELEDGDIRPALMGETGVDIKFSPKAAEIIPFDIECKNQETASIWAWMRQAVKNSWEEGRYPLLVFTKNKEPKYVCLLLDDFLGMIEK